jgi:membrane protein YdbS with pleckstrin-like domain
MGRQRATLEKRHLLPIALVAIVSFAAMGLLVQVGKSAIYVGAGAVIVAFAVTVVLIVIRQRRNARMMEDILAEKMDPK